MNKLTLGELRHVSNEVLYLLVWSTCSVILMKPQRSPFTPWRYTGSGLNCKDWLSLPLYKDSRCPSVTYRSPPTADDPLPHYAGLDHSLSELEWRVLSTQVKGQSPLSLTQTVAGVRKCCSGVWRKEHEQLHCSLLECLKSRTLSVFSCSVAVFQDSILIFGGKFENTKVYISFATYKKHKNTVIDIYFNKF